MKDQSGFFWVEVADGTVYMCRLRGKLMEEAQSSDIAAIGDRVKITLLEEDNDTLKGVVEEVFERDNVLSRAVRTEGSRGAGQPEREQVLVANLDQAFFVFAAAQPLPNLQLLDRFLVVGEKTDIEKIVIVVNKIDLEDPSQVQAAFASYEKMGYEVVYTSALDGHGIDTLRQLLKGKISAFTGPSGVGKTSLLNRIQDGLGRAVKQVSQSTFEGIHTTRDSALIKLDPTLYGEGSYLADTPGLRQLTIWDVEPEELDAYFVDIAPHIPSCRFGDCAHHNEPGCAVTAAVKRGEISLTRYQSYLKLREELEAAYELS